MAIPYPHIFLITIDALRRDFVSLYGEIPTVTPFLDSLAEDSVIYENAYTSGLWTDPGVTSLYTGLHPGQHRILAGTDTQLECRTVAEILRDQTYQTVMVGDGSGFISQKRNILKGFNHRLNTFDVKVDSPVQFLQGIGDHNWQILRGIAFYGLYGKDCRQFYSIGRFRKFLSGHRNGPLFAHLHQWFLHSRYLIPWHKKWSFLKQRTDFDLTRHNNLIAKIRTLSYPANRPAYQYLISNDFFSDDELEVVRWLYAASAHYADYRLSRLFAWAKKAGYLDNAIWIITSDHGEMLGEHRLMSHNFSAYQEIVRVPLIIHAPGLLRPARIINQVSHVDIAGAILQFIGNSEIPGGRGLNILADDFDRPENQKPVYFEDGRPSDIHQTLKNIDPDFDISPWDFAVKGVIQDRWKYVMRSSGEELLYDLSEQPLEEANRLVDEGDIRSRLRKALMQTLGDFNGKSPVGI
ncbi:MAG: sulfatase [Candidatus Marinimicrobia bacterium]|nr:sulfatase [Candidatus Neomarinimicrobiota bacterium]